MNKRAFFNMDMGQIGRISEQANRSAEAALEIDPKEHTRNYADAMYYFGEKGRALRAKKEKVTKRAFWDGFEKKAFAHLHFIHHTGLTPEEKEDLHKSVEFVGSARSNGLKQLLKDKKFEGMEFGGKNNWTKDSVEVFLDKHPHLKDKVWVGGTHIATSKTEKHPFHSEVASVGDVDVHPRQKDYFANHVGKPHKGVSMLHVGRGFKKEWNV